MNQLIPILESKQTVFTISDIQKIASLEHIQSVRNFVSSACQKWYLQSPYHGIYTKKEYNLYELGTKIKSPSYISLDTILYEVWAIFQPSNDITLISNDSRIKKINKNNFVYHKIKDSILYNPQGIIHKNWVPVASPARALCDLIYLKKWDIHIDASEQIKKDDILDLISIYDAKTQIFISKFIKNAGYPQT